MVESGVSDTLWPMRALLTGVVLLGTVGCSDMLGLGGLTYDQGLEETEPLEGPRTTDKGTGLGLGGFGPGPEDYVDLDFPVIWPEGSLVTSLPATGDGFYYWVYHPDQGQLLSYLYQPSGLDLIAENDWPDGVPVSELLAFDDEGTPFLVAYSDAGWKTELTQVLRSGAMSFESRGASGGLSHVRAASLGGHDVVFSYDSLDGDYRFVPTTQGSEAPAGAGRLEVGFDLVERYRVGEQEGLLFFHAADSRLEFWAFDEDAADLVQIFSNILDFPVSHLLTFESALGSGILFYDTAQGLARVRSLIPVDESWELVRTGGDWQQFEDDTYLPQGLTRLLQISSSDWTVLGFNGATASVFGGRGGELPPIVVR